MKLVWGNNPDIGPRHSSDHKTQENIGKLFFFLFKLIESADTALIIHARDAVFCSAVSEKPAPQYAHRLLLSS